MDLQALASRRDDDRAREELVQAVHQVVRRYCRALLGRSGNEFGSADRLADELASSILREREDEFGGPTPAEAIVYSGMAPVVERVLGSRPPPPEAAGADSPVHVQDQLGRLPPRWREVLVLRAFVGMTSEQAGRALGVTPEVVLQEQRRALVRLRSL